MRRAGLVIVAAFLALGTARLAAQNWSQGPSGGARQGTTSGAPAAAGTVGEFFSQTMDFNLSTTASVTSASPAVITWTAHPFTAACVSVGPKCVFAVVFVNITGGAGITALQNYFIDPASVTANTFRIATTVANALAGVDVNTTSSGSGLMVGASYYPTSATIQTMGGFQLTPGDWDCSGNMANNSVSAQVISLFTASFTGAPNTLSTLDGSTQQTNATQAAATVTSIGLLPRRLANNVPTTIYFNGELAWTGGASGPVIGGAVRCRRMS